MRSLLLLAVLLVSLSGCGTGSTPPTGDEAPVDVPGFDELEAEIFSRSCDFPTCHASGPGAAGLSLVGPAAYDQLIGRPASERDGEIRVVVGDAASSYLIKKLTGWQDVRQMPPGGALEHDEIDRIAAWIDGGAPLTRGGPRQPTTDELEHDAVEDFPERPELRAGQRLYEAPREMIVPPGSERQFCYYLPVETETYFAHAIQTHQGEYGHHSNLLKRQAGAIEPTVKDCTSSDGMIGLLPILVPDEISGAELPTGMAIRVAAGTQVVIQSHYVNVTTKPLRIRDVLVIDVLDEAEVETEIGNVAVANFNFTLEPESFGQRVAASCPITKDINVMTLRTHMHERGVSIRVEHEKADGSRTPLFGVDPWQPEFRDLMPAISFAEEPLQLRVGDRLNVECVFDNETELPIRFPTEMCASFGFFHPVTPEEPDFICFVVDQPALPAE